MVIQTTEANVQSLAPVERYDTLADRAYEQLRAALMSGTFYPSQRLPIRKVAGMLGISATPAREALSRLVAEHGLDWGANRSVVVPILTPKKVAELYVIRRALEGVATELGAVNFTPEDLAALEQTQIALISAMDRGDYANVLSHNERFHFGIYRAAGLPLLVQIIQSVWLKLGPSLNLLYPAYDQNRKGVHHHSAVIKALRDRDPSAARNAIEGDLNDGAAQLTLALAASDSERAHPKRNGGRDTLELGSPQLADTALKVRAG